MLSMGHSGRRLPHTRGGVSKPCAAASLAVRSSPHTWGCFFLIGERATMQKVFPTHVGVFPGAAWPCGGRYGLPHTRGGVSIAACSFAFCSGSSPHTWGCFRPKIRQILRLAVFPTHVGVFLTNSPAGYSPVCLPHTRGGVSCMTIFILSPFQSSPHTWGCFSFAR